MNLAVAVRVHHHEVGVAVLASIDPPDNVMDMPPRLPRDQLLADWATAVLFQPEVDELLPTPQRVLHFEA